MSDALSIATHGLMQQTRIIEDLARTIATPSPPSFDFQNNEKPVSSPDLITPLIKMNESKEIFKANVKVIKAVNDMTKQLLDILA